MKFIYSEHGPEIQKLWIEGLRDRGEPYMIALDLQYNADVGDVFIVGGQALKLGRRITHEEASRRYGKIPEQDELQCSGGIAYEVTTD